MAESMAHPIPTDLEAVKLLAAAPGSFALFVWPTYRCFTAKDREFVPLLGPFGLTHQLGCVDYTRVIRGLAGMPARISPCGRSLPIAYKLSIHPSKEQRCQA